MAFRVWGCPNEDTFNGVPTTRTIIFWGSILGATEGESDSVLKILGFEGGNPCSPGFWRLHRA